MEAVDDGTSADDQWNRFVLESCRKLAGLPEAHLSPALPPEVLSGALATYLHLQPGELLLAILDSSEGEKPDRGCALTTRRFYWAGPPQSPLSAPPASEDPESGSCPPRSLSVAYDELREPVYRSRYSTRGIELGDDRNALVSGLGSTTQETLIGVLNTVARSARDGLAEDSPTEITASDQDQLRAILWLTGEARSQQRRGHSFEEIARLASPRLIVTPLIAALCVGIFAIMAIRGVSPVGPTTEQMYSWGASFGPGVIIDGEFWRLLTCMFLHYGFLHLAFNMWCLVKAGPLVERLFGHLGFAALYLLSGIGGSLASLWYHPMVVSAGASGAIFGIFGALLGCSVVQSHALSASAWKPLRASVLTFIAYNIAFGFMSTGIDNAAHLGGLATGLVCGLLLSRPQASSRRVRRLVGATAIAGGLVLIFLVSRESTLARIEADPGVAGRRIAEQRVVDAYNGFMDRARPFLIEFDRLGSESDAIGQRIDRASKPDQSLTLDLDRLIKRSTENEQSIHAIAVEDTSLRESRDHLASAQNHLAHALRVMKTFHQTRDEKTLEGPDGYAVHLDSLKKESDAFQSLVAEYVKKHGLVIKPE